MKQYPFNRPWARVLLLTTLLVGILLSLTLSASAEAGTVTFKVSTPADTDLRDDIFFAMAERRYAVISMDKSEHSLEEIFLSLTAKGKKQKEVND